MNINPATFRYSGDEVITLSGKDFETLMLAINDGISLTINKSYPFAFSYYDENDILVENPKESDVNLTRVFDLNKTLSNKNYVESFDKTKLTNNLVDGQMILAEIHLRNIEEGIAKSKEDLEKANV